MVKSPLSFGRSFLIILHYYHYFYSYNYSY